MLDFFAACFGWFPAPLAAIATACFSLFAITVLVAVIRMLVALFNFLASILGGLFAKVVQFFV